MPNYSFLDLSPIDFEDLSRDLLQKHFNLFLESFKEGRDEGIDLRYSQDDENTLIIQCKRYTSITDLKWNLKQEVKKAIKLSPKRYVLVTSVNLAPKQKKDIKTIFRGVKLYLKDILGRKDLNNLLGKYPDIEKNNYKLWFNSTAVLERIMHSSIYNRAEFEKEEIEREIKIYVTNDSNKEAIEILNNNNYVIISGIPGIGKTTLARMLLYNFILEGWDVIPISSDINEAEEVYKKEKKQVFYYDDFLGTNFLAELILKNEDKRIIKFIERIKKSKNKKFILTTREYILNQAIQKFESLHDKSLEIGKCTIDLQKYNTLIKGRILYNHLYYSELDHTFFKDILLENRFLKIINHPNYNPRIIQYLTNKEFLGDILDTNYYNFFIENLANPQQIWNYAFNSHITTVSRYLLVVFITLGEPVFKEDLYIAMTSFFEKNEKHYGIKFNEFEYANSLRECERTFITIEKIPNDKIIIRFQNPSIKDFLLNYLNEHKELTKHLIKASVFFNQLLGIFSVNKDIKKVYVNEKHQNVLFKNIKQIFRTSLESYIIEYLNSNFEKILVRKFNNKIERLKRIALFFDLSTSQKVVEFLYNAFTEINFEEEIQGDYNLNNYITLAEKINRQKVIDSMRIIENIFTEGKIESFEDIKEAERLKHIFPDDYAEFEETNEHKVIQIMNNAVSNEYSKLELLPNKYKINEFTDELSQIAANNNIDVSEFHKKAIVLLVDIEEEEKEEITNETKSLPKFSDRLNNDIEVLINIFNSLKIKN